MKHNNPLYFKNYFSYLYHGAKNTTVGTKIKNIYKFFKKYILVGRIFRIAKAVFLWVKAGTYLLLVSSALVVLVPLTTVSAISFASYTLREHKRCNKGFTRLLQTNDFRMLFSDKESLPIEKTNFNGISIVVITDPFTGLSTCAKKYDNKHYFISTCYFYSLRKHVLKKHPEKIFYDKKEKLS